jgi:hypothetical protein
VLFHDTNVHEHNFGVWRLWAELRDRYPAFEFLHGHGLGVLAVGAEVSGPVAALCAARDPAEISTIRERFSTLGERWIAAQQLLDAQELTTRLRTELGSVKAWAETAQTQVNALFPAHAALVEKARVVRLSLAEARCELALKDAALAADGAERTASHTAADHLTARMGSAQSRIEVLLAERRALLRSASWRVTAPLRRAMAAVRRQPYIVHPDEQAGLGAAPDVPQPAKSRVLFISGEDHTPGNVYRVERYVATARALGFNATWKAAAPVGPADLEGTGLIVLWRVPFGEHVHGIIEFARTQGAMVIFDVDDLMFRPEMAVIDIIDGIRSQKFSELQTQAFFTSIGATLKGCDIVTCPTAELAHHARLMGRPAYVLPNGFDDASHDLARQARRDWQEVGDDLLRIGYAGGSRTHQRDFAVAAAAIARVLGKPQCQANGVQGSVKRRRSGADGGISRVCRSERQDRMAGHGQAGGVADRACSVRHQRRAA